MRLVFVAAALLINTAFAEEDAGVPVVEPAPVVAPAPVATPAPPPAPGPAAVPATCSEPVLWGPPRRLQSATGHQEKTHPGPDGKWPKLLCRTG